MHKPTLLLGLVSSMISSLILAAGGCGSVTLSNDGGHDGGSDLATGSGGSGGSRSGGTNGTRRTGSGGAGGRGRPRRRRGPRPPTRRRPARGRPAGSAHKAALSAVAVP